MIVNHYYHNYHNFININYFHSQYCYCTVIVTYYYYLMIIIEIYSNIYSSILNDLIIIIDNNIIWYEELYGIYGMYVILMEIIIFSITIYVKYQYYYDGWYKKYYCSIYCQYYLNYFYFYQLHQHIQIDTASVYDQKQIADA